MTKKVVCYLGMSLSLWSCSRLTFFKALSLEGADGPDAVVNVPTGESLVVPSDISQLLQSTNVKITSKTSGLVDEAPLPQTESTPFDKESFGFGKSSFIAETKWATVRYLGANPAGAGLNGTALEEAQKSKFGSPEDSIPVVTAAITVENMMNHYFAPLLLSIPKGNQILPNIHVQGAYYSPTYRGLNGEKPERDNAYIVGTQSLIIYPSSCFDNANSDCRKPYFSTGHDPTVIGHELGHVIFYQLRKEQSLDGFQWFAVNEGYADYFSASFFSQPFIGRIWKYSKKDKPYYLRSLLDTPTISTTAAQKNAHQFSTVWSSSLWRSRNRIIAEFSAKGFDVDRIVLQSISYLGETEKARLGDAATAVIKASETLGYPQWKKIFNEEFSKAEIDLSSADPLVLERRASDIESTDSMSVQGCGNIAAPASKKSSTLNFFFILLPLIIINLFSRRSFRRVFVYLNVPFLMGCHLLQQAPQSLTPLGNAVQYNCAANPSDVNTYNDRFNVYLTHLDSKGDIHRILLSDERQELSQSALVLVVDGKQHRIDQVRTRDGAPFTVAINEPYVSTEVGRAQHNLRLAYLLLEEAAGALLSNTTKGDSIALKYQNEDYAVAKDPVSISDFKYGPLPKVVKKSNKVTCEFQGLYKQ